MMRALAILGLSVVALAGAPLGNAARAADLAPNYPMPPVYSEPDPQFEFGTGWYLRGDVGYSDSTRVHPFGDLTTLTSPNDFAGGVGVGYRWNQMFRTDLTANFDGYQSAKNDTNNVTCVYTLNGQFAQDAAQTQTGYFWTPNLGTCTGRNESTLLKTDIMASGYFDMGTWSGLTPYIGAGLGLARIDNWTNTAYYKTSDGTPYRADLTPVGTYPLIWRNEYGTAINPIVPTTGLPVAFTKQNWSAERHRTQYNLAWSLMGGVAYAIDDHIALDLGYRYINLGGYKDATGRSKSLDAQQVRVGIRYAID